MRNLSDLTIVNFPLVDASKKAFLASVQACYAVDKNSEKLKETLLGKQKLDNSKRPL